MLAPEGSRFKHPPPLRSNDRPWGLDGITSKQYTQVDVGNVLLLFALRLFAVLLKVGGSALLEHPAQPRYRDYASTIWRTGFVKWALASPAFKSVDFEQGVHGQKSRKPTRLLALRLPALETLIKQRQTPKGMYLEPEDYEHGPSYGLGEDGQWRTSSLKTYPPSMNCALSKALHSALAERHARGQAAGETVDDTDITVEANLAVFMTTYDPYGGGCQSTGIHSDHFNSEHQ